MHLTWRTAAQIHKILILLAAFLLGAHAYAAGRPFDQAAFQAAQKTGQPILLEVHADWCTTCRAQEPVVQALLKDPKFSGFVVFRVDFDQQKDVLRQLRVQYQSTLVVFKGTKEVARSTAATSEAAIAAQLARAL